jgi:hypothetical protein
MFVIDLPLATANRKKELRRLMIAIYPSRIPHSGHSCHSIRGNNLLICTDSFISINFLWLWFCVFYSRLALAASW